MREEDGPAVSGPARNRPAAQEDAEEAVVLTW